MALTGDAFIYRQFVEICLKVLLKIFKSLDEIHRKPLMASVSALLRTYALCCMNRRNGDEEIRMLVLEALTQFIAPQLKRRRPCESFRMTFMKSCLQVGLEKPCTFFATVDVFRRALPVDLKDLQLEPQYNEKYEAVKRLWSDFILECKEELRFITIVCTFLCEFDLIFFFFVSKSHNDCFIFVDLLFYCLCSFEAQRICSSKMWQWVKKFKFACMSSLSFEFHWDGFLCGFCEIFFFLSYHTYHARKQMLKRK